MILRHSKKTFLSSRVLLILLIIFAAFLAAFLGQVAINLLTVSPSLLPEQRLIIRQSQDVYALLHNLAQNIEARESDGFVQLYTQQIDNVAAPVAQGVIITNDGWMLTVASPDSARWQWARLESGELLPITKIIQDPATPLLFVKTEGANLQPVTLADRLGTETWGPKLTLGYARETSIVLLNEPVSLKTGYVSSDQLNRFYQVSGGTAGQALYSEKGEIIGLLAQGQNGLFMIDVQQIRLAMDQVLRSGLIRRPSLGVQYIDLASRAFSETINPGVNAGALLTNAVQATQPTALPMSGLAYKSGLRMQDVIVSVNGTPVNHTRGLSDLVLAAKPGDTVELGVLRSAKTVKLDVALGESVSK
jgi:serine protease Do